MSLLSYYIKKNLSGPELENELIRLISKYNKLRNTYLLVFSSAIGKPIPDIQLNQSDYFVIYDLLRNKKEYKKIDIYLETPGGKGETAEEIVRFLRDNFEYISFVISGEAKSAGTIMALSGNEILMTGSGSLGPIDAQILIGRTTISAYDYLQWVEEKRKEAEENRKLNPVDATMIAQITPGELGNVFNALKFAEELVVEWLQKYKFKNWEITETRKIPVSEEMKKKRAEEIARLLCNRKEWRRHGRSIKIDDLEKKLKLKIVRIDDNPKLADIVYKIQTVCRLLFDRTTTYKIYATAEDKIFRTALPQKVPINIPKPKKPDVAEIEQKCPQCGKTHKIYAKLIPNPKIDEDFSKKGFKSFPKNDRIICECGHEIDLSGIKEQIELQTKRKIIKGEK